MSSTLSPAARPSQRKVDILAALLWTALAVIRISLLVAKPSLLQAGLTIYALSIPILFIIRRPARTQGPVWTFWLAVVGTSLPVATLRPIGAGWPALGEVIQLVGLVLVLAALWTLNRSFGLAPADRGLVTRGVYRLVRHPLYAGELVAGLGYCVGYASVWNWAICLLAVVAQVARIMAEEKLLAGDDNYRAYQRQARWRLIPGVW